MSVSRCQRFLAGINYDIDVMLTGASNGAGRLVYLPVEAVAAVKALGMVEMGLRQGGLFGYLLADQREG